MLEDFRVSVEQSLELPLTLNLYESQFHSRDGALDFSSTRYSVYKKKVRNYSVSANSLIGMRSVL